MENTQGIWILSVIVLSSNFLIADEEMTAAKIYWIKEIDGLNQSIDSKNIFTSKW